MSSSISLVEFIMYCFCSCSRGPQFKKLYFTVYIIQWLKAFFLLQQLIIFTLIFLQVHHQGLLPQLCGWAPSVWHHQPPLLPERPRLAGGSSKPRPTTQHRLPAGGTQVWPGSTTPGVLLHIPWRNLYDIYRGPQPPGWEPVPVVWKRLGTSYNPDLLRVLAQFHFCCSRWPVRRQRSWLGRMGCDTSRHRPVTPSTWSTPSLSWPGISLPWCGPATSRFRRVGRGWRVGSCPMWFTPRRRWRRVTAAVFVDLEPKWRYWRWRKESKGKWLTDCGIGPVMETFAPSHVFSLIIGG